MLSTAQLERAASVVDDRLGLLFQDHRLSDLERGLRRAMRARGEANVDRLVDWLARLPRDSADLAGVAGFFTVGETYFFRNAAYFDALESTLLPRLIAARRASGSRWLRIWSAGCATGEEAYSLAIVLDRLLPDLADWGITILATDIDADGVERARRAVYRRWSLREASEDLMRSYLRPRRSGHYEVVENIRRMVSFQVLNLAGDAYPAMATNTIAMDLVVCRNVLMYLSPAAQQGATDRLQRAIVPGGWLVVAPAEGPSDGMRGFRTVTFPDAVFYERESGAEPFAELPGLSPSTPSVTGPVTPPAAATPTRADAHAHARARGGATPSRHAGAGRAGGRAPRASAVAQARSLADSGRLDEAYELCQRRLDEDPLDGHAYLLLGSIWQERGDPKRAIAALRQCVYLMPASAAAYFLLAGLLQRESSHGQARRALDTVIELLDGMPADCAVEDADGLTAGRLIALARAQAAALPAGVRGRAPRTRHRP